MSLRFLMDEHVPRAITKGLRRRGIDVLTVQEDGVAGQPDSWIIERAAALGRAVYTQDRDFLREAKALQTAGRPFPGVIYSHRLALTVGQVTADLTLLAEALDPEEVASQVTFLPLR